MGPASATLLRVPVSTPHDHANAPGLPLEVPGSLPHGERREESGPVRDDLFVNEVCSTPGMPGPAKNKEKSFSPELFNGRPPSLFLALILSFKISADSTSPPNGSIAKLVGWVLRRHRRGKQSSAPQRL